MFWFLKVSKKGWEDGTSGRLRQLGGRLFSAGNIVYSAIQTFTGNSTAGSLHYDILMLGVATIPFAGPSLSLAGSIFKPEIMQALDRTKAGPYPQNSYILK